jgi:predicted nucleic acid-binding protein
MIVVADSSPLIVLVGIGQIEVLPRLFGEVVIPPEVLKELALPNRSNAVREFVTGRPAWLLQRAPAMLAAIPALHAGELAAISLAEELKADLLLIDEMLGRRAAADRHIPNTGKIGVLELAADRGMLDLQDAFARVKETDFWISRELLDERLRLRPVRRTTPRAQE